MLPSFESYIVEEEEGSGIHMHTYIHISISIYMCTYPGLPGDYYVDYGVNLPFNW